MISPSLSTRDAELEAAHRHAAALRKAIHRHHCWCGVFGPHRFVNGGPWYYDSHIVEGEGARPIEKPAEAAE